MLPQSQTLADLPRNSTDMATLSKIKRHLLPIRDLLLRSGLTLGQSTTISLVLTAPGELSIQMTLASERGKTTLQYQSTAGRQGNNVSDIQLR